FSVTASSVFFPLSLHDALPILIPFPYLCFGVCIAPFAPVFYSISQACFDDCLYPFHHLTLIILLSLLCICLDDEMVQGVKLSTLNVVFLSLQETTSLSSVACLTSSQESKKTHLLLLL